ncbi:MAG: carbohydrate ABC transporter substrate-binding protein, partial [bacterium]|nr:carbohydrate ABC transporter substrate-binding protein [bacterium]
WTWEDFEKIALEIHEKSGIWGMGADLWNNGLWKAVFMGVGQQTYSADGKSLGYTDDQPLVDYMNMFMRLEKAGAIPTHAEDVGEFWPKGIEGQPIVSGKAAMVYMWSNQIIAVWNAAGEGREFKMVHLPRAKADGPAANYVKPGQFLAVTAHSKHPKEAAMFINYFTNSIEANKVLLAERGVPISSVVADGLKELLTSSQIEMFDYMALVETDSSPLPLPDPVKHAEIWDNVYLVEFISPILYGQISAEDGVKRYRDLVSEILAED